MFPEALRAAIEAATDGVAVGRLRVHAADMSAQYRAGGHGREPLRGEPRRALPASGGDAHERRLAYIVTRMPATYAAISAVLWRLGAAVPGIAPASLLDLGAGPATGLWATSTVFPNSLAQATLLDADVELLSLGLELWERAHPAPTPLRPLGFGGEPERRPPSWGPASAGWSADSPISRSPDPLIRRSADPLIERLHADLRHPPQLTPHDLVLCAYVLGELADDPAFALLDRAWTAAGRALVIVEPGWPRGHARLLAWRDRLMARGAHVVAPCPHDLDCPLVGDDWCHFAARLERTRRHRLVKGASLGWEDEKFAYLVAARPPASRPPARIIAPPRIEKGHVGLRLCRDGRADDVVVARREATAFKAARKADWGDGWP